MSNRKLEIFFLHLFNPLHRGAICQVLFRWIYYCHSSESTGKKTGKTHLCALCTTCRLFIPSSSTICASNHVQELNHYFGFSSAKGKIQHSSNFHHHFNRAAVQLVPPGRTTQNVIQYVVHSKYIGARLSKKSLIQAMSGIVFGQSRNPLNGSQAIQLTLGMTTDQYNAVPLPLSFASLL